jgi:hypothetical protein
MPRKRKTTHIRGRGGYRPGAGRPKGAVNKVTKEERERIASEGILPLDYMLKIMRDARYPKARRDEMAKAAAPYLHAKLSSVEVSNKKGEALKLVSEQMTPKEAAEAFQSAMAQPSFDDEEPITPTTH